MFAIRLLMISAALLFAMPAAVHAGDPTLEEALVQSADTPQDHATLAKHFRAKAEEMRRSATRHRRMAETYSGHKHLKRDMQKKHCQNLAELNEKMAAEYEALAEGHEEAAKP